MIIFLCPAQGATLQLSYYVPYLALPLLCALHLIKHIIKIYAHYLSLRDYAHYLALRALPRITRITSNYAHYLVLRALPCITRITFCCFE